MVGRGRYGEAGSLEDEEKHIVLDLCTDVGNIVGCIYVGFVVVV